MTCQELLALSGILNAALATRQIGLDSFFRTFSSFRIATNGLNKKPISNEEFSCCERIWKIEFEQQQHQKEQQQQQMARKQHNLFSLIWYPFKKSYSFYTIFSRKVKTCVKSKYFNQGILLAILINTLSMGIEYHNQPNELTTIVEISNIIFSTVFAIEMLLKIISDGIFGYISNGFNVFDGIVVILR